MTFSTIKEGHALLGICRDGFLDLFQYTTSLWCQCLDVAASVIGETCSEERDPNAIPLHINNIQTLNSLK